MDGVQWSRLIAMNAIGTLNEKALHAALKAWIERPCDRAEVPMHGYVIDIVRDDLLIEIQTRNFSSIKRKLRRLVSNGPVRLVYPIAQEKWIVKLPSDGEGQVQRRKSPKRGTMAHVFDEWVSFPDLICHPNFSLLVVLIEEEELRRYDGHKGWRRRGWVTQERRLSKIISKTLFEQPEDVARLIPKELADGFTTAGLAAALGVSRRTAQKMAYCLRHMDLLAETGKCGNALIYGRRNP